MELDLCFKLINCSLIRYASFTNEISANLNMKAVSFFDSGAVHMSRARVTTYLYEQAL